MRRRGFPNRWLGLSVTEPLTQLFVEISDLSSCLCRHLGEAVRVRVLDESLSWSLRIQSCRRIGVVGRVVDEIVSELASCISVGEDVCRRHVRDEPSHSSRGLEQPDVLQLEDGGVIRVDSWLHEVQESKCAPDEVQVAGFRERETRSLVVRSAAHVFVA